LNESGFLRATPRGAPLRPDDEELPQAGEEEASVALEAAASKEPVWPGEKPGERRPFYEVKLP
jgi:hypothetical protein